MVRLTVCANALLPRGTQYEARIWGKQSIAIEFMWGILSQPLTVDCDKPGKKLVLESFVKAGVEGVNNKAVNSGYCVDSRKRSCDLAAAGMNRLHTQSPGTCKCLRTAEKLRPASSATGGFSFGTRAHTKSFAIQNQI